MATKPIQETNVLTPVDEIVAGSLFGVARAGRGFILDLERELSSDQKKISIVVQQPQPQHDEYRKPADDRMHVISDTASFLTFAKRYGKPAESLVFVDPREVVLILNEGQERGVRERASMALERSTDWKEWSAILGQKLQHQQLYRFLLEHERNLLDPTMLVACSRIKATATVSHESDLSDAGDTVGIVFKTNKGDELQKFPKAFKIGVSVLEQDDAEDSDNLRQESVEINLLVNMPTKATEFISFELKAPLWKHVERSRVLREAKTISEGLPDFTVVSGRPGYDEKEIAEPPSAFEVAASPVARRN